MLSYYSGQYACFAPLIEMAVLVFMPLFPGTFLAARSVAPVAIAFKVIWYA
jgi:hypothetical protein